jgi:hypothetical protein
MAPKAMRDACPTSEGAVSDAGALSFSAGTSIFPIDEKFAPARRRGLPLRQSDSQSAQRQATSGNGQPGVA